MLNDWLDTIHNCGFSADVMFTKDGDRTIALHWTAEGHRQMKLFQDIDADKVLAQALEFVERYDAFINTKAECAK